MLQAKRLTLDTKETDTKGRKKQKKTKGRGESKKEAMKEVEVEKPKGRSEDVVCGSVRTRCYGSSALGALLHVWPAGVLLFLFISLH